MSSISSVQDMRINEADQCVLRRLDVDLRRQHERRVEAIECQKCETRSVTSASVVLPAALPP